MTSIRPDPSHPIGFDPHRPAGSDPEAEAAGNGGALGLSIIVPARDEAPALPVLVEEIQAAFRPLAVASGSSRLDGFEILVIDDASTDETPEVLARLVQNCPELRAIRLARNVGQSAAIATGFHAARGAWVATIDADLQNDPADLARLWTLRAGYDAVLGWRKTREDVWTKRQISRWANRVRNAVLGQAIRDTGCALRVFPRAVALRLPMFHGAHRFFGPLLLREGCAIRQEPVGHRPRPHGTSHYNMWNRSFRVLVDLFGVAWLMRRPIRPEIETVLPLEAPSAAKARPRVAERQEA